MDGSNSSNSSSSSESEDETPALKIARIDDTKPTVFPAAIAARLKNLAAWVSDMPVSEEYKQIFKAAATFPPKTTNEKEKDEEDDDEVSSKEDKSCDPENPFIQMSGSPTLEFRDWFKKYRRNRRYKFGQQESDIERFLNAKSKGIRLREKAQHKVVIDKSTMMTYYGSPPNFQLLSSTSKTEDDIDSSFSERQNTRKVMQQPFEDSVAKHVPSQSVSRKKNPESSNSKESDEAKGVKSEENDDDDDYKIIDFIRLPKFKPTYIEKPDFFSAAWLAECKNNVEQMTAERMKIVQERDEMIERLERKRILKELE